MINLELGIGFEIEGELGKYQTLPISKLVEIAESLQELIFALAKFDLPAEEAIRLSTFNIELSGFQKGSAIPIFQYSPRIQTTISDFKLQRDIVNDKLNRILELADNGDFQEIKEIYPDAIRRNVMVENIARFTNSFGTSPVKVHCYDKGELKIVHSRLNRLKPSVKKLLMINIKEKEEDREERDAFARVKIYSKGRRTTRKIKDIIEEEGHSISYSPEVINLDDIQYILNFPLRCSFEREDDYYIIRNEMLDLIGTGETQEEAERSFNEEFDNHFNRLNELNDDELSERFINIRKILNYLVKEIHR